MLVYRVEQQQSRRPQMAAATIRLRADADEEPCMAVRNGILPWTRSCFVCGESNPCGLHLRSRVEDGRVVLDYQPREADLGYRHIVHGGLAITLLDEVMTWAAIIGAGRVCVAAELTTRLKLPIRLGRQLRVEGWVTTTDPRLLRTEGRITDTESQVYLQAKGRYVPMPADQAQLTEKDFVLSAEALQPRELFAA